LVCLFGPTGGNGQGLAMRFSAKSGVVEVGNPDAHLTQAVAA